MSYTSENTHVLATYEQAGGNMRMLLFHIFETGRHEYVIGSYFHEKSWWERPLDDTESGYITEYEWDWGHYFSDIVNAVDYWKREVLGEEEVRHDRFHDWDDDMR